MLESYRQRGGTGTTNQLWCRLRYEELTLSVSERTNDSIRSSFWDVNTATQANGDTHLSSLYVPQSRESTFRPQSLLQITQYPFSYPQVEIIIGSLRSASWAIGWTRAYCIKVIITFDKFRSTRISSPFNPPFSPDPTFRYSTMFPP